MNKRSVVVTGLGVVSCFGRGVGALWDGLVQQRSGRRPIESFDASPYRSHQAAEVPWPSLLAALPNRQVQEKAALLAQLACEDALVDAGLERSLIGHAGCILGTLCGGAQTFEDYGRRFNRAPRATDGFPDVDECLVAYQVESLAESLDLRGPCTLVSTACSSTSDAIGFAADMIRQGRAELMLAGGADLLSEVVHAGFNSVFSITTDRPRPFDSGRSGFVIGEGGGILVLESAEHARARGATALAEVLGYGLSNAAFHLTATSEDGQGESLAILRSLQDAGVSAADVDYVNVHGTSTTHNDLTEVQSLRAVYGQHAGRVAVSSIKPNIGHCMGAAGVLEAIATIQCIRHRFVPGMIDTRGDIDTGLNFVLGAGRALDIRVAVSQSFGFGGACSAIVLGRPGERA